ncbi:MAG: molybdate ABC transporter substrate-binding protein [bacterium]
MVYTIPLALLETSSLKLVKKLITICIVLGLSGCQYQKSASQQAASPELLVAAAANLTDAFAEIGPRFTSKTGIRVVFSFGATAELAKQIENGAPFDVFAAADTEHVDSLDRAGLLTPGTRSLYARGRLVMWLPAGSTLKAGKIEDITAKQFDRIAIAKPDVAPYGQAAVESLQRLGIWNEIESRVIYAQNVSQAKQYAATGNAEVAFIPLALVKTGEGNYVEVNENLHRPIDQALGVIQSSTKQEAARQFVQFVLSREGQELLLSKGYSKPGSQ